MTTDIKQQEARSKTLNDYYMRLYQPPDEDLESEKDFEKMKGLILNLARCEAGLELLHEALQESGGVVLKHPKKAGVFKVNPINAEILKQRSQMKDLLQMLERHLSTSADYEEDELNEFL